MPQKEKGWGHAFTSLFVNQKDKPEEDVDVDVEPVDDGPITTLPPMPGEAILNASGAPEIPEGRTYDEIYHQAGVPACTFPVERLLATIAGMSHLRADAIPGVIAAMDAADESWTIQEVVSDAEHKIDALEVEKDRISSTAQQIEAQGRTDAGALDADMTATADRIKQAISALQDELHAKVADVATKKSEIDAKIQGAKDAANREAVRLDSEIGRLNRVPNTFGSQRKS